MEAQEAIAKLQQEASSGRGPLWEKGLCRGAWGGSGLSVAKREGAGWPGRVAPAGRPFQSRGRSHQGCEPGRC